MLFAESFGADFEILVDPDGQTKEDDFVHKTCVLCPTQCTKVVYFGDERALLFVTSSSPQSDFKSIVNEMLQDYYLDKATNS